MNSQYPEEEEFNSDNEYDPMKMQQGQGIPHLADGGILDDENQIPASFPPKQPPMPPKLPGMPQGVTPDALQPFLGAQKASLNKFGPDKQFAVEQALTASRRGVGPSIANAGAGFADALMQGVARAGPGNFQANMQNRQDKMISEVSGSYDKARTGTATQMKAEMELAEIDPTSPISATAQKTNRPTLTALGYSDEEIAQIPASMMGEATAKRISLEEIVSRAEETRALREQTGLYQQGMLENTRRGQASDSKSKAEAKKLDSAKGLSNRPWYQKAIEMIPGMKSDSTKVMQEGLNNYSPDVISYAESHGISPEAAQAQKDKRASGQ